MPGRIKAVAQMNYQLNNYDKAIEYGSRAIKGGFADDEMKTLVGASRTTLGSEARSVWAAFLADSKSRLFLSFLG